MSPRGWYRWNASQFEMKSVFCSGLRELFRRFLTNTWTCVSPSLSSSCVSNRMETLLRRAIVRLLHRGAAGPPPAGSTIARISRRPGDGGRQFRREFDGLKRSRRARGARSPTRADRDYAANLVMRKSEHRSVECVDREPGGAPKTTTRHRLAENGDVRSPARVQGVGDRTSEL